MHSGLLQFARAEPFLCCETDKPTYLPFAFQMMQNLLLSEGDIIKFKSTSLPKGTYVKLRPQSKDFLDISNPKAVLETTLRRYSCLTTGDSILINYNNKRFFIDIFETRPQRAVTIIEVRSPPNSANLYHRIVCIPTRACPALTRGGCGGGVGNGTQTDCEVDFAPPLDYVEPVPQPPSAPAAVAGPLAASVIAQRTFLPPMLGTDGLDSCHVQTSSASTRLSAGAQVHALCGHGQAIGTPSNAWSAVLPMGLTLANSARMASPHRQFPFQSPPRRKTLLLSRPRRREVLWAAVWEKAALENRHQWRRAPPERLCLAARSHLQRGPDQAALRRLRRRLQLSRLKQSSQSSYHSRDRVIS